jgi:hypothetical protein
MWSHLPIAFQKSPAPKNRALKPCQLLEASLVKKWCVIMRLHISYNRHYIKNERSP